jgi:hypothetical protein
MSLINGHFIVHHQICAFHICHVIDRHFPLKASLDIMTKASFHRAIVRLAGEMGDASTLILKIMSGEFSHTSCRVVRVARAAPRLDFLFG